MTYLFGVKDDLAQAFIQVMPAKNVAILRRELTNLVNNESKSMFYTNPSDFSLYQLGYYEEETGVIASEIKLEFNFADLKANVN